MDDTQTLPAPPPTAAVREAVLGVRAELAALAETDLGSLADSDVGACWGW